MSVGYLVDRGIKYPIRFPVHTVMVLNILIAKMGGHMYIITVITDIPRLAILELVPGGEATFQPV
jgi:hypothetical protein